MLNAEQMLQVVKNALTNADDAYVWAKMAAGEALGHVDHVGSEGHQGDGKLSWVAIQHGDHEYKLTIEVMSELTPTPSPKLAYELILTVDEVTAIGFWKGRCGWADASFDALHDEELKLSFETEADAWEWQALCENDAEGGHSMFSGVASTMQEKLQKLYDSIV